MSEWNRTKPPNGVVVEVIDEGKIIRVRANYGNASAGVLPHWESEDGDTLWRATAFSKWRAVQP